MKLNTTPRISGDPILVRELREHAIQINKISEGFLSGTYNAYTSYPTTGTWAIGDYIKNSAPAEAGVALGKYVILGWVRITNGSANVLNTDWIECRSLTGN